MQAISRTLGVLVVFFALAGTLAPGSAQQSTIVASGPGALSVTSSGSAHYVIDFVLPPGTAGLIPVLSLVYDSQQIGANAGAGWTLSGISAITRGPRSNYQDGRVSGVSLGNDDALYLEGQRLIEVNVSGSGSSTTTEYRKEIDDQTRVVRVGDTLASARFAVQTKGGLALHFTGAGNSNVKTADGAILLWLVSRTSDTTGNFIDFRYEQNGFGDYSVADIAYTGHETVDATGKNVTDREPYAHVHFEYGPAPRTLESYLNGRRIVKDRRLLSVSSSLNVPLDNIVEKGFKYQFDYEERQTTARFVLTGVRLIAPDGKETEPTRFKYTDTEVGWAPAAFQLPIGAIASKRALTSAFRFVHVSETGSLPDLLFSATVDGRNESFAFINNGTTWSLEKGFSPPVPFANADGSDLGTMMLDLDGDGRVDMLQSYRNSEGVVQKSAHLASKNGWTLAPSYVLPFVLSDRGKPSAVVFTAFFSGGAKKDLLYASEGAHGMVRNDGAGWQSVASPSFTPTADDVVADVDCDGVDDFLSHESGSWLAWKYLGGAWQRASTYDVPLPSTVPRAALRVVRTAGAKCSTIIAASAQFGLRKALTASSNGWADNAVLTPTFDLVDATGAASQARNVDLDKDGSDDIIANLVPVTGATIKFGFRQDSTGWQPLSDSYSLPVLDDLRRTGATATAVIDLDGDGYVDILTPDGPSGVYASVFTGSSTGFTVSPIYVPDIPMTVRDKQDAGVRFVDLNGDGLPDILFHRSVTANGTTTVSSGARMNTGHGWTNAPGLTPPLPFSAEYITGNPVQFVDVDMDGYIDALYSYRKSDGTQSQSFWHNESDGAGGRKWVRNDSSPFLPQAQYPFAQEKLGDLGVRFVDLNGDGRVDLVVGKILPSNNTGQTPDMCEADPQGGQQNCHLDRSLFDTRAFLNTVAGWKEASAWKPPLPLVSMQSEHQSTSDLGVQLIDINGDTLPDIVARFVHPYDSTREVSEVWLNTGSGWALDPSRQAPALLDIALRNSRALFQWIDLNGDSLYDLVYSERNGQVNTSITWLNTGTQFVAHNEWQLPLEAISERPGDPSYRLMDLNGDGRPDLVFARKTPTETVVGAYTNTGSQWTKLPDKSVAQIQPFIDENGLDQGVRILDVDGNGLPDFVRSYASGPDVAATEQSVLLSAATRADVLKSVASGFGVETTIEYQSLLEHKAAHGLGLWAKVYERTVQPVQPLFSPVPMLHAVRRTRTEAAGVVRSASYRYGDFLIDTQAMKSLGFTWREVLDEQRMFVAHEEFEGRLATSGRMTTETRCWLNIEARPSGDSTPTNLCPYLGTLPNWTKRLQASRFSWDSKARGVTPFDPKARLRQVALTHSENLTWELDGLLTGRSSTLIRYDEPADLKDRHLNAVETNVVRMDGSSVRTVNDYNDDSARWRLGRLTRSTTTHEGDLAADGVSRESDVQVATYTYSPTSGLLMASTTNPNDPLAQTTTFIRDASGNVTSTRVSAVGHPSRTALSAYDPLGRFLVESTNAVGHVTRIERRQMDGKPIRIVDPNGVVMAYQYDQLGRMSGSTPPTGLVSTVTRLHVQQAPPWVVSNTKAAIVEQTQVGALPPKYQVFDALGRLIRVTSAAFTLNDAVGRWTHTDTSYDPQSRPIRVSLPYYSDKQAANWITVAYDAIGRETERQRDGKTLFRTTREGRSSGGTVERTSDPLGRVTLRELSVRGLLVATEDALGRRSTYAFDPVDRLTRVNGPLGSTTRITYDNFGRRRALIDPDMGHWTYRYDAFGQLVEQTDAKGQVTLQEFDLLGRIVRTTAADGQFTAWEYDNAAHGIGMTSRIEHGDYKKEFFYDTAGRNRASMISIGTDAFTTVQEFDSYDRVNTIRYPAVPGQAPLVVRYVFDTKGYLKRVTDSGGLQTYWEILDIDAWGRPTKERGGNGTITTRTYSPLDGSMSSVKATNQATVVYDLTLKYDAAGNLASRTELGQQETYAYDLANQLTARELGTLVERYVYDKAGRLTEKAGTGTLGYPSSTDNGGPVRNFVWRGQA